jgi:hypothetical protein
MVFRDANNVFACNCPGGKHVCKHIRAVWESMTADSIGYSVRFWKDIESARRQRRRIYKVLASVSVAYATVRRLPDNPFALSDQEAV